MMVHVMLGTKILAYEKDIDQYYWNFINQTLYSMIEFDLLMNCLI